MSADHVSPATPSSASASPPCSHGVAQPAPASSADSTSAVKQERLESNAIHYIPSVSSAALSVSSPLSLPLMPLTSASSLLPGSSLFSSPFITTSSLLPASMSSPMPPSSLQSLLMSLRATSQPSAPLVPIQLVPGPLLMLPSTLQSSSVLQRHHSLPHLKLLTFSASSVMHQDIPSSLPSPPSPTPSASAPASVGGGTMELSPYASPQSPLSPLSGSSTDSDDSSRESDDKPSKQSKRKSRKSKRPTSFSETDNDDTDSTHSASSSSSSSSSDAHEAKKRRCVVSAQKLLTEHSAVELSLSIVHFHAHSIRIIHTHSPTSPHTACYVHGADVGGVIERKSNISRMFGQFESPREKVLMNVTGKHNHTVGQEANVLTVAGVERLMTLKKCAPNTDYCDWLRTQLLPRLKAGNSEGGAEGEEQEGGVGDREVVMVDEVLAVKSETEGEAIHAMTSLCTATV